MSKSMTLVTEEEIEICDYCKGIGFLFWDENVGVEHAKEQAKFRYNKKDFLKLKTNKCHNCNGKGRIRKITTIEYKQL